MKFGLKQCGHCHANMFDDMDMCYECGCRQKEREELNEYVPEKVPLDAYFNYMPFEREQELYENYMAHTVSSDELLTSAQLLVRYGSLNAAMSLSAQELIVGASEECAIRIQEPQVPSKCLKISRMTSGFEIRVLNGAKCVSYEGKSLDGAIKLHNHNTFSVGSISFEFVTLKC